MDLCNYSACSLPGSSSCDYVPVAADHGRQGREGDRRRGRSREGFASHVRVGALQRPDGARSESSVEASRTFCQQHRTIFVIDQSRNEIDWRQISLDASSLVIQSVERNLCRCFFLVLVLIKVSPDSGFELRS